VLVNIVSGDPPQPPADVPDDLVRALEELPADRLRTVARYAEAIAADRDGRTPDEAGTGTGGSDGVPAADDGAARGNESRAGSAADPGATDGVEADADVPDDVPAKATITVKEINDNRYYYWQWRDGDKVRSKYKGPVDPG